jgi:hypothetical protein
MSRGCSRRSASPRLTPSPFDDEESGRVRSESDEYFVDGYVEVGEAARFLLCSVSYSTCRRLISSAIFSRSRAVADRRRETSSRDGDGDASCRDIFGERGEEGASRTRVW